MNYISPRLDGSYVLSHVNKNLTDRRKTYHTRCFYKAFIYMVKYTGLRSFEKKNHISEDTTK